MDKTFNLEISQGNSFAIISGSFDATPQPIDHRARPDALGDDLFWMQTAPDLLNIQSVKYYSGDAIAPDDLKSLAANQINERLRDDFSNFMGWKK